MPAKDYIPKLGQKLIPGYGKRKATETPPKTQTFYAAAKDKASPGIYMPMPKAQNTMKMRVDFDTMQTVT